MTFRLVFLVACGAVLLACSATNAPATNAPPTNEPATPPVATPSVAPTLDPDLELQRIMELRSDWGLQSDREWVLEVAEDPNADDSILGVPITPAEAATLEEMFSDDPRSRLTAYGYAHPDQFAGSFVDGHGVGPYVLLFTGDLDRHRAALEALPGDYRFDVRLARYTEAELKVLMMSMIDELRTTPGVELLSVSLDTIGNAVTVEAKSNDSAFESRLEAQHPGMLNATVHPLPGPWQNAEGGAGWRLLAAGSTEGGEEAYTVRAATTDDEWNALWTALDPVNAQPEVDLESEVVVSFGHGIGSSCREMRLDDVVIDAAAQVVFSRASDPLGPRTCTADLAGAAFFVVALDRASLPESPFTVRLNEDPVCGGGGCGFSEELELDLGD